jgi:endonuclease/exonuclease/phosphatase family metal-dependent hydrolase
VTLRFETRDALPVLDAARRAAIRERPATPQEHAALRAELPWLDAIECRAPPPSPPLGSTARVVAWNAERCARLDASARWLEGIDADVLLLSELDWGMARSGQRHTPSELAERLGCGFAFGIEFLELDLGSASERRLHAGSVNEVGCHGNAILSRHPLHRPALLRLDEGGGWFDGARGERRVGGRVAVLAQLELAGVAVSFVSLHLESHADPAERARELGVLLTALERYDPRAPVVIGGDLNAFSLALADLGDRARVGAALREDPRRWRDPVPHEPLFAAAEAAGFDWRRANAPGEATHRVARTGGSARGELKLDWFLCRGVEAAGPRVLAAVDDHGVALSDHEAIEVRVRPPARP